MKSSRAGWKVLGTLPAHQLLSCAAQLPRLVKATTLSTGRPRQAANAVARSALCMKKPPSDQGSPEACDDAVAVVPARATSGTAIRPPSATTAVPAATSQL